jgi:hypothetical protein
LSLDFAYSVSQAFGWDYPTFPKKDTLLSDSQPADAKIIRIFNFDLVHPLNRKLLFTSCAARSMASNIGCGFLHSQCGALRAHLTD